MTKSFAYRIKLAAGFLHEAQEDVGLMRWRSAVDNAQLAVENAACNQARRKIEDDHHA